MASPEQPSSARSDLIGAALWVGLGALILFESLRMERFEKMGATVYTYPGFVPGILGGFIVLLGLGLGWRGLSKRTLSAETSASVEPITPLLNRRVLIALACTLAYSLLLLTRMPFLVATALFVAVFTFLNMEASMPLARRCVGAALSGLCTSLVVFYAFQEIFLVRLP